MVELRNAPANAVCPEPIPMAHSFDLDVDDSIWQDVGLDENDDLANPPLWLCDEKVRSGIQAIVVQDRCKEEQQRVLLELKHLHEWFTEEWQVVVESIAVVSNIGMVLIL